jgi:hypothetical protein
MGVENGTISKRFALHNDVIYTCIQFASELDSKINVCFMDERNAFDTEWQNFLFDTCIDKTAF